MKAELLCICILLAIAVPYVIGEDFVEKKKTTALNCPDVNQEIYTGYLKVRKTDESRLFYTLYTPIGQQLDSTVPVILWFEGGPGQSALFTDLAHCRLDPDGKVVKRANSWNEEFFLLTIDGPIGTGFSYAAPGAKQGIDENTADLMAFFETFFTHFKELKDNHFYLVGEGYAGHTLTAFANALRGRPDLMLVTSIILNNPWIDPKYQMNWDEFGFAVGLLDTTTRDQIRSLQTDARLKLLNDKTEEAGKVIDKTKEVLQKLDDQVSINNFGKFHIKQRDDPNSAYHKWVEEKAHRDDLGIPASIKFSFFNKTVHEAFNSDFSRSYFQAFEELLFGQKVLVFCGQNDYFTNCAGIHNVLKNSPTFNGDWSKAPTNLWTKGTSTFGNVKIIGKGSYSLYYAVIYKAGHFALSDQGERARSMLDHFKKGDREWTGK